MPPGTSWQLNYRHARCVIDEGGQCYAVATRNNVGVTMVVIHRWTGRLLAQVDYPWSTVRVLGGNALRNIFMDFFRRPPTAGVPVMGGGDTPMPHPLAERAPVLGHFLCSESWPDGEARQRSSLVIFCEDGAWKVCLSDKDSCTSLWAGSKCFDDLLEALEARLTDDRVDWRKSRKKGK